MPVRWIRRRRQRGCSSVPNPANCTLALLAVWPPGGLVGVWATNGGCIIGAADPIGARPGWVDGTGVSAPCRSICLVAGGGGLLGNAAPAPAAAELLADERPALEECADGPLDPDGAVW